MLRLLHIPTPRAVATNRAAVTLGGSSITDTVEGPSLVNTATFLLPSDYPRGL